jgi:hypothetical protein
MSNRSLIVAVAIAVLVSGVSASPGLARGANGGAAAGAAGSGGPVRTLVAIPQSETPPRVVHPIRITVDHKIRCGKDFEQRAAYDFDEQMLAVKCNPTTDDAFQH